MKWIIDISLRYYCKSGKEFFSVISILLMCSILTAQINYIPNPGFEEVSNCDLEYGDSDKAIPWEILEENPPRSPDLFHACSTSSFYLSTIETPCVSLSPRSGEGMVGMVTMAGPVEEKIYVRLTENLPLEIDIYVAFHTRPNKICGNYSGTLCYSNTMSMAFSGLQFEAPVVAAELDNILYEADEWTKVEGCYRANGEEKYALLGNFKLGSETLMDCSEIEPPNNYTYYYVDDIIVAPFDVVPDTLFICGDEILNIDATFYDVPILWDDGWGGAIRDIEQGGLYSVLGDLGDCFLTDEVLVIEIPEEFEEIQMNICKDGEVELEAFTAANWSNGSIGNAITVFQAGNYSAILNTPCGERINEFTVEEKVCKIQHFVPNIFTPNDDGYNDKLEFFFSSEFDYSGDLNIFDRWGNLIYRQKNVNPNTTLSWDGIFKGKKLDPSVYVWVFTYSILDNDHAQVIFGNVTLIR